MEISEEKRNILRKKEIEAYNRIVELQEIRKKRNLTVYENQELEKRWAYYNGLTTVLDILKYSLEECGY